MAGRLPDIFTFAIHWIAALALSATLVLGQAAAPSVDIAAWQSVAERAEAALESGEASSDAFESLRAEIVEWREQLIAARTANESRIATLRSQIEALGPAPAEGEAESEEIAARRQELNDQLAALEAPRRTAEEAYTRADGLIAEIDTLIRERQANALLEVGPSPLNPALWAPAAVALGRSVSDLWVEFEGNWNNPNRYQEMRSALPVSVILMIVAVTMLSRGRTWMERLTSRAERRYRPEGRDALAFFVSLGQVLLPTIGILAFVLAVNLTDLLGPKGEKLLGDLPTVILGIFAARWLGARVFPKDDGVSGPIDLAPEQRTEGRWYATTMGLLYGLGTMLLTLSEFPEQSAETMSVLAFPVVAVAGIVLFRLGQFLSRASGGTSDSAEGPGVVGAVLRLASRAVMAVGIGGPVLFALGYLRASEFLLFPTVLSLALVALLAVLHAPIRDLYAVVTRMPADTARDALGPVLITFTLSLLSLPVFALIWGARTADILELWSQFQAGLTIGETRIAPGNFMTFLVVFVIGFAMTRFVQGTLRSTVLPRTKIDAGGRNAVTAGVGYVGIFLAALVAITSAGIDLSSLAIVAGALSVGIGFGLQNIVSNFVSGIILLIERPISEGDWIEVGGQMGIVKDISVRSTRIETFDRKDVIVPNADFVSGQVTNWTRGNLIGRVTLSVGVAYSADSRKVEAILQEICDGHPLVLKDPEPKVLFRRFGADSLEFDCFCVISNVNFKVVVESELNHQIHARFREEGIEIPFAQRDVWLRNPEALVPAAAGRAAEGDRRDDPDPDQPEGTPA